MFVSPQQSARAIAPSRAVASARSALPLAAYTALGVRLGALLPAAPIARRRVSSQPIYIPYTGTGNVVPVPVGAVAVTIECVTGGQFSGYYAIRRRLPVNAASKINVYVGSPSQNDCFGSYVAGPSYALLNGVEVCRSEWPGTSLIKSDPFGVPTRYGPSMLKNSLIARAPASNFQWVDVGLVALFFE